MGSNTESDAEKALGSRLDYDLMMAEEYILSDVEKNFILSCERGDLPGVKKWGFLPMASSNSANMISSLKDPRGVPGHGQVQH